MSQRAVTVRHERSRVSTAAIGCQGGPIREEPIHAGSLMVREPQRLGPYGVLGRGFDSLRLAFGAADSSARSPAASLTGGAGAFPPVAMAGYPLRARRASGRAHNAAGTHCLPCGGVEGYGQQIFPGTAGVRARCSIGLRTSSGRIPRSRHE